MEGEARVETGTCPTKVELGEVGTQAEGRKQRLVVTL